MMKKRTILLLLSAIVLCAVCLSACQRTDERAVQEDSLEAHAGTYYDSVVAAYANEEQYSYAQLSERSEFAAIIQSTDMLTQDNSRFTEDRYDDSIKRFYSIRGADILVPIKGEGTGASVLVFQEAAVRSDGKTLRYDNCWPLIEREVYALFALPDTRGENAWQPLSTDNGLLNLSYLKLNRRVDLAGMLAVSLFESDFPKELVEAYCGSVHPANRLPESELIPIYEQNLYPWEACMVSTPYTMEGMELTVEYLELDGIYYFRTEGCPSYYAA